MKLLLIGSGGREHALAWKLSQSSHVEQILVIPGNPGIAQVPKCQCTDLALDDLQKVADFAEENSVDLTVVGPEATLVAGIADIFRSRGLPIFGPDKAAAELEGSKAFSKRLMQNTTSRQRRSRSARTWRPPRPSLRNTARRSSSRPMAWRPARASSWP